jgi:glutaredoxin-dependent peroxiredoxin
MANQIKIGDQAPDFTLPDEDMKPRSLKEFLGQKIVLAFFVGAFTETCTKEACEFRDSMSRLVDLKAQIIGIDLTAPFSTKRFAEKNRLPFPMLSDSKHEVFEKYGLQFSPCDEYKCCWGSSCYPLVKRSLFILDEKGTVRYVWISNNLGAEPSYEEMQKIIELIT